MLSMKDTNKLLKNILRALPALSVIPLFAPKKSSFLPFMLGAVGVTLASGVAALMVFSPRTRHRALDIAKDSYGKVRGQLDGFGSNEKVGIPTDHNTVAEPYANGLGSDGATSGTT